MLSRRWILLASCLGAVAIATAVFIPLWRQKKADDRQHQWDLVLTFADGRREARTLDIRRGREALAQEILAVLDMLPPSI